MVPGSATLSRPNISGNTGFFSGGTVPSGPGPVLGIPSGVYLATGDRGVLQGPNNRKNYSTGISTQRYDADLASIAGTNSLFDTVILTFEVIPQGRSLVVDYVFGSEEYPEYVCSQFNDAMGIFVSGPGISGSFSNNAVNVATLPNGRPISINTVNGGVKGYLVGTPASGCDLTNTAYYVDNGDPNSNAPPNSNLYTNTQLDGFTVPLRGRVAVQPGQRYRIKIAIADVGDRNYDSALLVRMFSSQTDWGDAPDTYGTTLAQNGASHDLDPDLWIGPTPPDHELDGQPTAGADGDDANGANDEDTFSANPLPPLTIHATSYSIQVPVQNRTGRPGVLAGWIDFNRNGVFDPGERAVANVPSTAGTQVVTLTWSGLSGLVAGPTYLRLRLSTDMAFLHNPQPTGHASDGEVEDHLLFIGEVYSVSGHVYHDLEPNGLRGPAEDWQTGATVWVKLVQGNAVVAVAQVDAGTGAFQFQGVSPGTYTLLVDNNDNPADTTPTPPPGWLFVNPPTGSLSVTVSGNTTGLLFGLFHGAVVEGRVFWDDGLGGGAANDAWQNGGEAGVGNVEVRATDGTNTRLTLTDGTGYYRLYIPASWGGVTLSHPLRPATGWNDGTTANPVDSWASAQSPASPGATVSLGSGSSIAGQNLTRNFGVVRESRFYPDATGQTSSPGTYTFAHWY
ncbi:choice-of-anchor L domain-containing protein, partial [Thermus tengchongensis]|uniref:choice-of-anchor L domain-containing protein n=1 Tax=Thermus tengchongensis TaxID=1214928 RepID=UPI0019811171